MRWWVVEFPAMLFAVYLLYILWTFIIGAIAQMVS